MRELREEAARARVRLNTLRGYDPVTKTSAKKLSPAAKAEYDPLMARYQAIKAELQELGAA